VGVAGVGAPLQAADDPSLHVELVLSDPNSKSCQDRLINYCGTFTAARQRSSRCSACATRTPHPTGYQSVRSTLDIQGDDEAGDHVVGGHHGHELEKLAIVERK
jgi:hypothetical protein